MTTLVFEGWRQVPHSYAMCLQQLELECLRRPDVQVYHTSAPYPDPNWKPESNLFSMEDMHRLLSIPTRPLDLKPDAVIRMTWPFNFEVDRSNCPTFIWGTTECRKVLPIAMASGKAPEQELPGVASQVIAISRWAAEGFIRSGVPVERVHVIPAGVDASIMHPVTSKEDRDALRRNIGIEESITLLNIGAMTDNKGVHLLLHAAALLLDRFPNLRVVLKGSDSIYKSQKLLSMYAKRVPPDLLQKIEPHVRYTGLTLSAIEMRGLFHAADFYVAPYMAEGFNLPVLEAAACGVPVICTAGGPTEDFVQDSWCKRIRSKIRAVNEFDGDEIVPDFDHLVELLAESIADQRWRDQAAVAGPKWVQQHFTWGHVVDKIINLVRFVSF
ncbi:MAG: glycosyltransferase family 4 protein [Pirellulaceae bacterium]|nr:glycosyltransferase family 4 protein [Pirellulaceae bacterium]